MVFAKFFLDKSNEEQHKSIKGFDDDVVEYFKSYPWYGNLREMKNVVKRASLLTDGDMIEAKSLPSEISNYSRFILPEAKNGVNHHSASEGDHKPDLKAAAHEAEYDMILKVLKQVNFNKSKAAKILNIDRKTLYNKMKVFNI